MTGYTGWRWRGITGSCSRRSAKIGAWKIRPGKKLEDE